MAGNERLRRAMLAGGQDPFTLAERIGVHPKSVERWLAGRAAPHPRTRWHVAATLGCAEHDLWPELAERAPGDADVQACWARRALVPPALWTDLLLAATDRVDLLAYAGLFLVEGIPGWLTALAVKLDQGVTVRLALGDPHGIQLAARDAEVGIPGGVAGRQAATLAHYQPLTGLGLQIRLHDTPLYASVYRFDDQALVNVHCYGTLAFATPVLHLRRVDGAWFDTYTSSFERVWQAARPVGEGPV